MTAIDIVTLDEVKQFLNIGTPDADTELGAYITTASQMWVNRYGPVGPTAYTETYPGGRSTLALRRYPVVSVSSVMVDGVATTAWTLDADSGVLNAATVFYGDSVAVTYLAGHNDIPADLRHAVLLLVKHLWETQRGAARRTGTGGSDQQSGQTFSWPWRVEQIGAAYQQPGFA